MPLEEGDMEKLAPPPNIEPKTADEVNRKAEGEVGVRQGYGRAEQARVVEVGPEPTVCPSCGQNTLKADMRRKVNRIYCTNCSYDQANQSSGVPSAGGVTVVSGRGVENPQGFDRQGTKILRNNRPS